MAGGFERGTFAKNSTGTANATQTISTTGQVQALILFSNGTAGSNGTFQEEFYLSWGFSDGTTHRSISAYSQDNAAASNSRCCYTDGAISFIDKTTGTATIVAKATVTFGASNGFTLTWVTNDTTAFDIHWIAISAVTNAKVVEFSPVTTTPGNRDITGLGFSPVDGDIAFFLPGIGAATSVNISNEAFAWGIGYAMSSSNQGCLEGCSEDGRATSDTGTAQATNRCLLMGDHDNNVNFWQEASFVQWITDGFRLNFTNAGRSTQLDAALVIHGGNWAAGQLSSPSAGTPPVSQSVTTVAFQPDGLMMWGRGFGNDVTIPQDTYNRISFGSAASSSSRSYVWAGDLSNSGNMVATKIWGTDQIARVSAENITAASTTTQARADLTSLNSNGFTLSWQVIQSGQAHNFFWIVFKGAGAAGNNIIRALPTETVTIGAGTVERLAAKTRIIPTQTVTKGESLARLATKQRPIPIEAVIISESILRSKGKLKAVPIETITIGVGTAARLTTKNRPISQSIAITESTIRQTAKLRQIPAETITIGAGTVAKIKGAVKTISQTTTIGEALAILRNKTRAISQTVAISGTPTRLATKARAITQTITIAGIAAIDTTKLIIRSLSDTVIIGEAITRQANKIRSINQSTNIIEALARMAAKNRAVPTETILISAGTLSRLKSVVKSLSQNIVLSENLARQANKIRLIPTQIVTISESASRLKAATRSLTIETIAIAGTVSQLVTIGAVQITRALSDTVVISGSVVRLKAAQRSLSEIVPKGEALARTKAASKSISQTVPIAELLSRIKSSIKTLSQTVTISESLNRMTAKLRTLSETIVINELAIATVTTGQQIVKAITETVAIAETLTRQAAKSRAITEIVQISEQLIHDRVPLGGISGGGGAGGIISRPRRGRRPNQILSHARRIGIAVILVKSRVEVLVPILILHTKIEMKISILKMPIKVRLKYASLPVKPTPIAQRRIFYAAKAYGVLKAASLLIPVATTFKARKLNVGVDTNEIIRWDKLAKIIKLFKMYNRLD